jgi:hypothetical protein
MPHFKCEGCRTRLHRSAGQADLVGDLCPGCGSLLEPVGELAEIVGFQSIRPHHGAADDGGTERIADRLDQLFARRDGGGGGRPRAMAAAIALPAPEETP